MLARHFVAASGLLAVPALAFGQAPKPGAAPAKTAAKTAAKAPEQRVVALARGLYRLTSLGDSAVLTARIFGENFRPIAGELIAWRSDDEAIATAAPSGVVSAMKNGTTRIWARSGNDSVFAVVTVEQRPVKLAFNLGSPIVFDALGASASLRAEQRDARGNPVRGEFPISTGCKLKDEGGSGAVQMSAAAKLTARANGAATLACSRGSVRDEIKIVVRQVVFAARIAPSDTISLAQAGDTSRLSVQAFDRLGKPITDARAVWVSLTPEIVDIEGGSGLLLGRAMGTGKLVAKFESHSDTIIVNVLAGLPEGKTLMSLSQARPTPPPVPTPSTAPVSAPPSSSVVGAAPPAAGAPLVEAPRPAPVRGTAVPVSTRRATGAATFAGASSGSSAAGDSVAIQQIIDAQVANASQSGRTWVITPMAMQLEYRNLGIADPNDSAAVPPFLKRSSQLRVSSGTLAGVAGQVQLWRSFYFDGHFATGSVKSTTGMIQTDSAGGATTRPVDNLLDGSITDLRMDFGLRAIPGLMFRVGYAQKTLKAGNSTIFQANYYRTGVDGEFSLFSDKIHTLLGFTYMPSVSSNGSVNPNTAMGGSAGVEYRAGWFTAGVDYQVESFEYPKSTKYNDAFQSQDRFSSLRFRLGVHFGR